MGTGRVISTIFHDFSKKSKIFRFFDIYLFPSLLGYCIALSISVQQFIVSWRFSTKKMTISFCDVENRPFSTWTRSFFVRVCPRMYYLSFRIFHRVSSQLQACALGFSWGQFGVISTVFMLFEKIENFQIFRNLILSLPFRLAFISSMTVYWFASGYDPGISRIKIVCFELSR